MATPHVTRPPRTQPQPFLKPALYAAVADLNRDLEVVIEDFRKLREFQFKHEMMDAFIVKIEDIRAWSNSELLETQHDRELKDWAHWGQIDRRFDAQYKDPNDVLLEADHIRRDQTISEVLREVERRQRTARKKPGK